MACLRLRGYPFPPPLMRLSKVRITGLVRTHATRTHGFLGQVSDE